MTNKISKISILVAFIALLISMLFFEMGSFNFDSPASSFILIAIFAVCFVLSQNRTLNNFGFCFSALLGVIGFYMIFNDFDIVAISLALFGAGALLYLITSCIAFFGYEKNSQANNLVAFIKMHEQKLISDEDFAEIKDMILQGKSSKISELAKWNKLLSKGIITQEDYTKVKEHIIK